MEESLQNKVNGSDSPKWDGKTGGGAFGQSFLLWFLGFANVRVLYPILYLTIPFYLLFGKKGRHAIYQYFRERHHYSPMKAAWATFRNHVLFGQVVLDKFALLAGNRKQFKIVGKSDYIPPMMNQEKGFFIVGAHVGNLELSGLCYPIQKKRINAIISMSERAAFQKRRDDAFGSSNINLIPVMPDMSHLFTIKEVIEKGEIVVIPSDRLFGSPKSVACDFLDGTANFPIGTFRLAAQLDVPVVSLFIMKEHGTTYKIHEQPIDTHSELPNSTKKAEAMTHDYVNVLQEVVKKYPTQWFNFFPFWNENADKNE